jgi:Sulfotransferase family
MNKPSGSERLIFVGGCPRSGTTLVQNMLDSHPDIFGGPEFLHLEDLIRFRKVLRRSVSVGWIDLFCSHDDLDHHLRTLIQSLFLPLADRQGCTYMSEKSPMNVLVLSELVELFPKAHFIHVIRDPRAIVSSLKDVGTRAKQKQVDIPYFTATISSSIAYTSRCFKAGFAAVKKAPDKILTITYESLVNDPEKELKQMCKFLGIEWNSQMMAPREKKHLGEKAITINSNEIWYNMKTYYQNPHDKNIEKWKKRLSPMQQVRITRAFKDYAELRTYGYDFSLDHLPWMKRILFTGFVVFLEFGRKLYTRLISLSLRIARKIPR